MKKYKAFICYATVMAGLWFMDACKEDDPIPLTAADRDKFIGSWAGSYQCGNPAADTLIIEAGAGELEVRVMLHASALFEDYNHGELTGVNKITIPEQTIAFFPGSGRIIFEDNELILFQSASGLTCRGDNYVKFE